MSRTRLVAAASLALAASACPQETSCPAGEADCGGTCRDLQTDPRACGNCLHPCPAIASCVWGQCICPQGLTLCGDACVDTSTDRDNCGTCGQSCGLQGACSSGTCSCDAVTQHSNGLGQTFFDCNPLNTYTQASATAAATAWSPTGTPADASICGPGVCLGRTNGSKCAVWCWDGVYKGQAALGASLVCQCPGTTDAQTGTWN